MLSAEPTRGAELLIDEFHQLPGPLIRRAHQIASAFFTANLSPYDLTTLQYATMVAIGSQPLIDLTRLSEVISFDKATLGGVIDRLEAKGLVRRSASKQDRRIKLIALTPEGEALLATVENKVLKAESDLLDVLSETEQRALLKLLRKFVASRSPDGVNMYT